MTPGSLVNDSHIGKGAVELRQLRKVMPGTLIEGKPGYLSGDDDKLSRFTSQILYRANNSII